MEIYSNDEFKKYTSLGDVLNERKTYAKKDMDRYDISITN